MSSALRWLYFPAEHPLPYTDWFSDSTSQRHTFTNAQRTGARFHYDALQKNKLSTSRFLVTLNSSLSWTIGMWAVGSPQVGKGTIWPALVQWLLAGGGMEPVGTWVVVAQQGTLVLQLAPKCPIFHGSAEPSATDAGTHRESTLLPVLYSALMTTRTIVMAAGEARPRRTVRCALAEGLNAIAVCFMTFIMFSEIFASFKRLQLVCNSLRRR